jgi:hypothetical protein
MIPLLNRGGMMKGFVEGADRQQTTLLGPFFPQQQTWRASFDHLVGGVAVMAGQVGAVDISPPRREIRDSRTGQEGGLRLPAQRSGIASHILSRQFTRKSRAGQRNDALQAVH